MTSGDLVFIGDVHLDREDAHLEAFLRLLHGLGSTTRRLVLMGDLFNLWIAQPELEQPHQTAVLDALRSLRDRGVVLRYLEGNRDYRVAAYAGGPLDDVSGGTIEERFGGLRILATHGDMANPADRQYRRWRRFSRSAPVWGLFNLLPRSARLRFAESLERRMRSSNPRFKREFPEAIVRDYGERLMRDAGDLVVLGHFHVEREIPLDGPRGPGRLFVLPEWKTSRRHLRIGADGTVEFVESPR